MKGVRTWIEVDKKALEHNLKEFLKIISPKTKMMAVVKSNAYGHGLVQVSSFLSSNESFKRRGWFGVDSVVEALRLRQEGIQNQILVLGSTLSSRLAEAAEKNVAITISNFESLRFLEKAKGKPAFHIKIDTGMHRQGFLPPETSKLIKTLKNFKLAPQGIYTHFASAKDIAYPTYTLEQYKKFNDAALEFRNSGFTNLIRHASASGGTLLFPQTHANLVRIGMGLYGYFPSLESKTQRGEEVLLKPVLSWRTLISEIKKIPKGSYVGYDLTERVGKDTRTAILPIGYWHGYDRGLSGIGETLVRGKRAKVLGRVSMDMIVVDVTNIPGAKIGDEVVLIGKQGQETIGADELALKIGTTQYEFLTRINPLIKKLVV